MRLAFLIVLTLGMWVLPPLKADQAIEKVGDVDIVREHDVMDGHSSVLLRVRAKAQYGTLSEKPELLVEYLTDGKKSLHIMFNAGVVCKSDTGNFAYMRVKLAHGGVSAAPQLFTWYRSEDFRTFLLIGVGTAQKMARVSPRNRQRADEEQAKVVADLAESILTQSDMVYIEFQPLDAAAPVVAEFDTGGMKAALARCAECGWHDATAASSASTAAAPAAAATPPVKAEAPSEVPAGLPGTLATIHISSDPTAADIELDGQYAGNTPSDIRVKPGQHTIKITKKGFVVWYRHIAVEGADARNIVAELERSQ
ncbi:MAG: PEGA domain-containing protein [Bryobacteraceae bacterium]